MTGSATTPGTSPEATIAVAGYNCEEFLEESLASALAQDLDLEVIVVDDASSDGTADLADRLARKEPRIRVLRMAHNVGPAGARNAALAAAKGKWFAILDADDLMEPGRLRRLIDTAETDGADLIADDLIVFDHDGRTKPTRFLKGYGEGSTRWIDLAAYLRSTRMYSRTPNLGYLKPVIRLSALREKDIRYDERLRIGEDDQFVFAMLLAGLRYRLLVEPGYRYRKHSSSISHRLSQADADMIAVVTAQMRERLDGRSAAEKRAFEARARSAERALGFAQLVDRLKAHAWGEAAAQIARDPGLLWMFRVPIGDRIKRLASGNAPLKSRGEPA